MSSILQRRRGYSRLVDEDESVEEKPSLKSRVKSLLKHKTGDGEYERLIDPRKFPFFFLIWLCV